jgi:hypothetical protein
LHVVCARICKRALGYVATLACPLTVAAWSPARLTRDLGGGERAAYDQLGGRIRDLTVGLQVGLIIPPAIDPGKPSRPGPSGQGSAAPRRREGMRKMHRLAQYAHRRNVPSLSTLVSMSEPVHDLPVSSPAVEQAVELARRGVITHLTIHGERVAAIVPESVLDALRAAEDAEDAAEADAAMNEPGDSIPLEELEAEFGL